MSAERRFEPYLLAAIYCAVPLATLVADNADLVRLADGHPYYLVTVAAACAAIGFAPLRGGPELERRTGICVAVGVLLLFDYRELRPLLGALTHEARPSMVFLWVVLVGVVGSRKRPAREAHPGAAALRPRRRPRDARSAARAVRRCPKRLRPPVRRREHGFVIPSRSRSNYPITLFGIRSILTMDYRDDPAQAGAAMAGRNRVVSTFRRMGYEFGLAPDQLGGWDCKGVEDICISAVETYASRVECRTSAGSSSSAPLLSTRCRRWTRPR